MLKGLHQGVLLCYLAALDLSVLVFQVRGFANVCESTELQHRLSPSPFLPRARPHGATRRSTRMAAQWEIAWSREMKRYYYMDKASITARTWLVALEARPFLDFNVGLVPENQWMKGNAAIWGDQRPSETGFCKRDVIFDANVKQQQASGFIIFGCKALSSPRHS